MRSSSMLLRALLLASGCLGLVACAEESGGSQTDDATAAAPTLKANVPGFTVTVEQAMRRDHRYGADVFVVHARTSKNLASAFAWSGDDEYGEALVVSPRVVEMTFDAGTTGPLLAWRQLFVTLEVEGDATPYYAAFTFAPKLTTFTGTSKIFVHDAIEPFLYDQETRFRGVASVVNGVSGFAAMGPLGAPVVEQVSARTFSFDFTNDDFLSAAHASAPVVKLTGMAGGVAIEKDATIELDVATIGLVHGGSAYDAFPDAPCSAKVEKCLEALADGEPDTGGCGNVQQVQECRVRFASPTRFSQDLKTALWPWYQAHGADVAAAGGNTYSQAIEAVDTLKVVEVRDPAEDPNGHDLTKFRVLSHPDVVFPGSDRRWFAAYGRADGLLEGVYDFE